MARSQLADAEEVLRDAGDAGSAARQQAAEESRAGRGPGSELLAAARAALSDDLNTPQAGCGYKCRCKWHRNTCFCKVTDAALTLQLRRLHVHWVRRLHKHDLVAALSQHIAATSLSSKKGVGVT